MSWITYAFDNVGIVWPGSVTFADNHNRSVNIEYFLPLAETPGVQLFSLQKGPREGELKQAHADAYIKPLLVGCEDFADSAAAIEQLDLVVMTDSSVAHLAASLGKPVINLLQKVPYWLYSNDEVIKKWYSSMHIIRQEKHNGWNGVFEKVKEKLEQLVSDNLEV